MATTGIDHIAMPTANAERLIAFYKSLGFSINDEAAWRKGKVKSFSIQVGVSKINVHPEGHIARLGGPNATPGCADICFVWDGAVDTCERMLNQAGVEIIGGPAKRRGGRGSDIPAVSMYARAPDHNLLEWMIYL